MKRTQHRSSTTTTILLTLLLTVAAAVSGCGPSYDCVAACEPHAENIALYGFVPDDGPVCLQPAIENASTCGECFAAITETHRIGITDVACNCPASEMDSNIEISGPDESCNPRPRPWTVESCFEFDTRAFRGCSYAF